MTKKSALGSKESMRVLLGDSGASSGLLDVMMVDYNCVMSLLFSVDAFR